MFFMLFFAEPFINNEVVNSNSRLQDEVWYHGNISRQQAEALLKQVLSVNVESPFLIIGTVWKL